MCRVERHTPAQTAYRSPDTVAVRRAVDRTVAGPAGLAIPVAGMGAAEQLRAVGTVVVLLAVDTVAVPGKPVVVVVAFGPKRLVGKSLPRVEPEYKAIGTDLPVVRWLTGPAQPMWAAE